MKRAILPTQNIDAQITLPGSKYVANRLLPLCALADSRSRLNNLVDNQDINTAIKGLCELGYQFSREGQQLIVYPRKTPLKQSATLFTAHSGTFSRFVSAIAALESCPVTINCSDKMATRPMGELFSCLRSLSVGIETANECLPATITGPIRGNNCSLDASRSSQYLSAMLMVAPKLTAGLKIRVKTEIVSRAYVDMTIRLMKQMGVEVIETVEGFNVQPGQSYHGGEFEIPADPVSATYFMGAAAIAGGKMTINNFDFNSVQGESAFYRVLKTMGVRVRRESSRLIIAGVDQLKGIEVDMGAMPDAVQTLAAVACFAEGKTHISNIAHLAYKESNRIEDTANELRKTGIRVESGKDFLTIFGGIPKATEIQTHQDHRMAMSLALLGIRTPGISINNCQVVEKSFPGYWDRLAACGVHSQLI